MNPKKTREPTPLAVTRKPRADGVVSRSTILNAAARLATTRGLEGLSIGDLAQHIGMSKSGLYAHFKSKEELELATIETAVEIFHREVIDRIPESSQGIDRIHALVSAFLEHLERRVFPGGCFFAAVAVQLAAHPGRARDRVMQIHAMWTAQFTSALRQSREAGELRANADLDQMAFEITAMLLRANFAWTLTEDTRVLDHARVGVNNVLAHAAQMAKPGKKKANIRNY